MRTLLQYCTILFMLAIKQPLINPILCMRKEKHIGSQYTDSCASWCLFPCLRFDDLVPLCSKSRLINSQLKGKK